MEKVRRVSQQTLWAPKQWEEEAVRWIAALQKVAEGEYDNWLTQQGMSPIPEWLKIEMKVWVEEYRRSFNKVWVEEYRRSFNEVVSRATERRCCTTAHQDA